jgi:hypothetical protein
MDLRKMVLGLTTLAIVAGLLLVCFAPGGWFNKGQTEKAAFNPDSAVEVSWEQTWSSEDIRLLVSKSFWLRLAAPFAYRRYAAH